MLEFNCTKIFIYLRGVHVKKIVINYCYDVFCITVFAIEQNFTQVFYNTKSFHCG